MNIAISSRTPEGWPTICPTCGAEAVLRFSDAGDATCPACGLLIWIGDVVADWHAKFSQKIANQLSVGPSGVDDLVAGLALDSLDVAEMAMEFEDVFGITISNTEYDNIRTLADLQRWIEERYPRPDGDKQQEDE